MQARGIHLHTMLPVGIFRRKMARVDLRNHRKLAIIDGRIAYTGSQNIVNASYGHKDMAWHDMMVRLTGPITLELQAIFVTDWHQETQEVLTGPEIFVPPELTGSVPAQTLPSGPTFPVENYQRLVVGAIYDATASGDHYDALFRAGRAAVAGDSAGRLARRAGRPDCPAAM